MLARRILRTAGKVEAYYDFIRPFETYTLRWIGATGVLATLAFLVIDLWRTTHYKEVALLRMLSLLFYAHFVWITFSKLTVRNLHRSCYIVSSCLFLIGFLMDHVGTLPDFFLPNYLILMLFVFNSALGHPVNFKLSQTILVSVFYIVYAINYSAHRSDHVSQTWNLLVNAALSMLVGYLLERYRLLNFDSRTRLFESRRKNVKLSDFKTKLISLLSHDLTSPLNQLKGLLDLNGANMIFPGELDDHLKKVNQSVISVSSTMDNLLRWSMSQMSGFKVNTEHINLQQLIDEITASLEPVTLQKDLTIRNTVNGTYLLLDREILKMIIRNFLNNAIKFSNKGDVIVVGSYREHNSLTVSVLDQGIGMSEDKLQKLFSFKTNPAIGTSNEKGSGIGLMMTKDFSEMLGGKISVSSVEGKGSEFRVTFPLQQRE